MVLRYPQMEYFKDLSGLTLLRLDDPSLFKRDITKCIHLYINRQHSSIKLVFFLYIYMFIYIYL